MEFKRRTERIVGKVDLVPLIDVVLLLLIFFVLSSRFIFQSVIAVDLPEAITADVEAQANHTIILTRGGLIFFDGRRVTEEGLNFGLELILARGRDPLVIIKADKEVPHSQVIKIMGLAKEAGIKRLALATEPGRE